MGFTDEKFKEPSVNESRSFDQEGNFTDSTSNDASELCVDWTVAEEKTLVRKVDLVLMPILILPFMALQLDRGNIGNAQTDNFLEDVGITKYQYNIGQQLLSAGIVILEIPSNLVLYRVGPRAWISLQIFAWGLVATFQAFQKGLGAYMATRLLLGLMEAGFIPASLYAITTWYKSSEMSVRFALFFFGNYIAQACSGLIAYGVLHMRGVAGLAGWQWLFIIEGLFTICTGFLYLAFYPKDRDDPRPFTGIKYFTAREQHILSTRVVIDDPTKAPNSKRKTISMQELKESLSDWTLYPHVLLTICALAPTSVFTSYGPKLIMSWGYERLSSNALFSIGLWIQVFTAMVWGFWADKGKIRGIPTVAALLLWLAFTLGCRLAATSSNHTTRLAMIVMSLSFSIIWHPLNSSWLAINARSPADRSIKMACIVMAANLAGIVGSQLFQSSDAPKYITGWTVVVVLNSLALFFGLLANAQYRMLNWMGKKSGEKGGKAFFL
ncbi:major facilitator superfamily domain-containing protein [Phyllosticta citricarpa]|uniref:Major facilitator superfamily domain-containing protein n=2 Tax=Phyllosticta TaxID=121621 RepID=A0ABR1L9E8_9PEZI